ncbi:MAG: hypothetical protein HWN65_19880 [Candidatus Helarchaeota archaeon]|nr:hypothetical protein [Candidatus Helarchaeota archaeon]
MLIDENYFENINNKEKAYWLGFLYADGCMHIYSKNNRKLSFKIHKREEFVIDRFLKSLNAEGIKKYYYDNTVYIKFGNKKLTLDLLKHGLVPRKSKIIEYPDLNSYELELAFLLGYYDGDGQQKTTRISSGSKQFLEKIKKKFQLNNKVLIQKNRGICYYMCLGVNLFNAMMNNYKHSIQRKRRYFCTKDEKARRMRNSLKEFDGKKNLILQRKNLKKLCGKNLHLKSQRNMVFQGD